MLLLSILLSTTACKAAATRVKACLRWLTEVGCVAASVPYPLLPSANLPKPARAGMTYTTMTHLTTAASAGKTRAKPQLLGFERLSGAFKLLLLTVVSGSQRALQGLGLSHCCLGHRKHNALHVTICHSNSADESSMLSTLAGSSSSISMLNILQDECSSLKCPSSTVS
jgi:hypothetical protein